MGSVASGATDSGNPVKVGGVFNTTPPTFTNGQRGDAQIDAQGGRKVSSTWLTPTTASVSALNGDLLAALDVSAYRSGAFQLTGTFNATVSPQVSMDGGSNWQTISATALSSTIGATGVTGAGIYFFALPPSAQFRLRVTAYTSGTVVATVGLSAFPVSIPMAGTAGTALLVGGSSASGAADSGNPVKTGGKYNATKPTLTDGQRGDTQVEANGTASVSLYGKGTAAGDTPMLLTPAGRQQTVVSAGAVNGLPGTPGLMYDNADTGRPLAVIPTLYNGGSTSDPQRNITTFKTATATASGDTALWTPTAGKRFRLMRFYIEITRDAATSGGAAIDILLRDATTPTGMAFSVYVPASGGTTIGCERSDWIDLGNGILSAASNNVLNINLSAALTAGKVRVVAVGMEE